MKKQILSIATISLLAFSVQASDVPYSYADIEYNSYDNADGFTIGGSYDFGNSFYGFGEYASIGVDNFNLDLNTFQIGAGYRYEMAPSTDLIGELSFVNADIDAGSSGSIDDSGYALGVGIRSMISPNLELMGKAEYVDVFDTSDTGFEFGGVYYFNNGFGLGASYETDGDDLDGFVLKGRIKF